MGKGFFEPSVWQGQRQPLALVPECGSCGLDRGCLSPRMPVSGKGRRKVLIVAEAPDQNEDERGLQLIGNAGIALVQLLHKIGINMRKDCWITNAVICRPPQSRDPSKDEVAFCRPNLTNTIRELQPDVIIPLGHRAIQSVIPLAWKDGEVDDVARWAGWNIPSQKLNTWICPSYPPSVLLKSKEPVAHLVMTKHLTKAFALKGKPWPEGPPNYKQNINVVMNPHEAADYIAKMMSFGKPLAVDIETTTLKPDGPHAEILCCAVSDELGGIAYPWLEPAISMTKSLLLSDLPKDVANLRFEGRWFKRFLKVWTRNWRCDTLLSTHLLNCTHGICSAKFQAFVLFGVDDYDSHIEPFKKSKDSNTPNRMKELEPRVMMEYCAYDALHESRIANKQMPEIVQC